MTVVGATFEVSERDIASIVHRLQSAAQPDRALLDSIGQLLVDSAIERISDTNASPAGAAWVPWSDDYAAWRQARGGDQTKLRLEGHLQGSMTWNVLGDGVEAGSPSEYAAAHQFGTTEAGRNRNVTIPARPYLGVSKLDEDRILRRVEASILRRLSAGGEA